MRKGKIAGITAVTLIFAGLTCTLAIINRLRSAAEIFSVKPSQVQEVRLQRFGVTRAAVMQEPDKIFEYACTSSAPIGPVMISAFSENALLPVDQEAAEKVFQEKDSVSPACVGFFVQDKKNGEATPNARWITVESYPDQNILRFYSVDPTNGESIERYFLCGAACMLTADNVEVFLNNI